MTSAHDRLGRRYVEVLPFDDGPVKQALAAQPDSGHRCVECGIKLVPGSDRYFQRNDPTDGTDGSSFERALLALTYDPVCGPCGDRAVGHRIIAIARFHVHVCAVCGARMGCTAATCVRHSAVLDHATHTVPEAAHVHWGEFLSTISNA